MSWKLLNYIESTSVTDLIRLPPRYKLWINGNLEWDSRTKSRGHEGTFQIENYRFINKNWIRVRYCISYLDRTQSMWYFCLGMIGQRYLKISKHGEEQREIERCLDTELGGDDIWWYLAHLRIAPEQTQNYCYEVIQHLLASVRSCKMGLSLAASCLSLQGLYNVEIMTLFLTQFVSNSLHPACYCVMSGVRSSETMDHIQTEHLRPHHHYDVLTPCKMHWPVIMTNVFIWAWLWF